MVWVGKWACETADGTELDTRHNSCRVVVPRHYAPCESVGPELAACVHLVRRRPSVLSAGVTTRGSLTMQNKVS